MDRRRQCLGSMSGEAVPLCTLPQEEVCRSARSGFGVSSASFCAASAVSSWKPGRHLLVTERNVTGKP